MSQLSPLEPGKAIRGGVPILFPQFGNTGNSVRHGFARTSQWGYSKAASTASKAVFELSSSEATKKLWPFDFSAIYTVAIDSDRLSMHLKVSNTGKAPLEFTPGLHGYFSTLDIEQTQISGLNNVKFRDSGIGDWLSEPDELRIKSVTDRVYLDTGHPIIVKTPEKSLSITQSGFTNTVVWNPWAGSAKEIIDMGDMDYKNMICIEPAIYDAPKSLPPGESWSGSQEIVHTPNNKDG